VRPLCMSESACQCSIHSQPIYHASAAKRLTFEMRGNDDGDGTALVHGLQALFAIGVIGAMIAGAAFGSIALFHRYQSTFDHLLHKDTVLAQLLYNDSVARELKDTLLQQQNDATNAELAAETPVRLAGFLELYWAILNETAARIAEEAPLFVQLANETAARIAEDTYLEAEIANLTSMVEAAEQYDIFSTAKFMIIMQNISTMDALLTAETVARIAADALLTEQGALADATIAYLTITLAKDTHDRIVQDVLIDEWIAALDSLGLGIESINGHTGAMNNNVDIVSTNAQTTITVPSPGQLVFTNNAVRTLQHVPPLSPAGNIAFVAGPGLSIVPFGLHGLHITSTSTIIGPNYLVLTATAIGPFSLPNAIDPPGGVYLSMPCNFPFYNGNTCGWSPTDTNTYIVEVSATLTVSVHTPDGINPAAVHLQMGIGRGTYNAAIAAPWATTEGLGGALDIVDGCNSGSALLFSNYVWDAALSATTVIQGPGSPGSWPAAGYGVWLFFKGYVQSSSIVMAITATYRVTKVL
jgi:hypothetical protein